MASNHSENDALDMETTSLPQPRIRLDRPVYTQTEFDEDFQAQARHKKTLRERAAAMKDEFSCKSVVYKIFPFLKILRGYGLKDDLVNDLISGLTVGVMHIPQGMAYGMLANIPPVYGLYVSFFPVIIYFFFGTSKHISMGCFAVVSLMTGQLVDKSDCEALFGGSATSTEATVTENSTGYTYTVDNTTQAAAILGNTTEQWTTSSSAGDLNEAQIVMCKVGVASAAAFIAGVFQLAMGLLRMGFVTIYLSTPITRGFTTAAAVYVVTSQIKHVVGLTTDKYSGPLNLVYTYIDLFSQITSTNVGSLVMAVICMIIIYLVKEYLNPIVKAKIKMPFPIELVLVIFGTLISSLADFEERFGMKVVGHIPQGLPKPSLPPFHKFANLASDVVGIAVVAFANNFAMAKLFAKKQCYDLDSNQELIAYGITNMGASFFSCFPCAASLSRSLVQEAVGGRTQVVGLVSCCFLLIVFYGLGPLFGQLPNCVLAAIVIVNLKGMFLQFKDLPNLWRIAKYDFAIWSVCCIYESNFFSQGYLAIWLVIFTSVCLLDVDVGLFVGVVFGLLTVVFRTQRPYTALLGRVPHTDLYKDVKVYNGAKQIPGIKIFCFESSLFYANSEHFTEKLFHKVGVNPRKVRAAQGKVEKKIEKAKKQQEKVERDQLKQNGDIPLDAKTAEVSVENTSRMYEIPKADISHLVIDCTPLSFIDTVGISTLAQAVEEYEKVGVRVYLAGCKAGVREQLHKAEFFEKANESHLYLSIHDAVVAAFNEEPELQKKMRESASPIISSQSILHLTDQREGHTPLLNEVDS